MSSSDTLAAGVPAAFLPLTIHEVDSLDDTIPQLSERSMSGHSHGDPEAAAAGALVAHMSRILPSSSLELWVPMVYLRFLFVSAEFFV
jgi:hypothetical protein